VERVIVLRSVIVVDAVVVDVPVAVVAEAAVVVVDAVVLAAVAVVDMAVVAAEDTSHGFSRINTDLTTWAAILSRPFHLWTLVIGNAPFVSRRCLMHHNGVK
jgi:hypothetical protein